MPKLTITLDAEGLNAIADAIAERVITAAMPHLQARAAESAADKVSTAKETAEVVSEQREKAQDAAKAAAAKKRADAAAKKKAEAEAAKAAAEEKPEEGTEENAEAVEVTEPEVRARLRSLKDNFGMVVVTKVLSKYTDKNPKKLADVDPSDYAALLADIEAEENGAEDDV